MQKLLLPALRTLMAASIGCLAVIVILNLISGSTGAAAQSLLPMAAGLFALWLLERGKVSAVKCPTCATRQPGLRIPNSLRQTFLGGWTCANCGTEIDRHGHVLDQTVR